MALPPRERVRAVTKGTGVPPTPKVEANGIPATTLAASKRGIQDESQVIVGFNQFANGRNTCPEKLENLWILTQMARWGLCAFPRNWISVIDQVLDTETYALAARELGLPDRAHDRGALLFADGSQFDGQDPIGYLESVPIRQELQLQDYRLHHPVLA